MNLAAAAQDFLAQKRIAVVGVSRRPGEAANFVFRKLRDSGHDVIPVNPRATQLEGVPCHPDLRAIPGAVDAVVIFTPPQLTAAIVRECADLGITRVWLHRAFGTGSFSAEAAAIARACNLTLIPGGCPAMFCAPVDRSHRCLRWLLDITHHLPRDIAPRAA
jgi:hypothetical protein